MITFAIRAEHRDGFTDVKIGAANLADARTRFQADNPDLAPFDWRGAVVFCERTQPAEEARR